MSRTVPEWIGKSDDAMPSIHVRLRIYAKQNGICACGKVAADGIRCKLGATHRRPIPPPPPC